VRQGVLLTATPYGESIWSYLHGFWGVQHWQEPSDALHRRLAWYEGLVQMQRLEPFFAGAHAVAPVAICVPLNTQLGALHLANHYWEPLAAGGLAPDVVCAADAELGQYECIVVASLGGLTETEATALRGYAEAGGNLIVTPRHGKPAAPRPDLSERAQRIVGVGAAQLATAHVLWERAQVTAPILGVQPGPVEQPTTVPAGEGAITLAPVTYDWLKANLAATVRGVLSPTLTSETLGEDYLLEQWAKQEDSRSHRLILCMAVREEAAGENARLRLPVEKALRHVAFLAPGRSELLNARYEDGELTVQLPPLDDSFGAVLLTDGTYPVLMPAHEVIECRAADTVSAPCSLLNLTGQMLSGVLAMEPPAGFRPLTPARRRYAIEPGEKAVFEFKLKPPAGVTREPHIVIYRTRGLIQRTVVLPTDGAERVITDMELTPEEYVATADYPQWPEDTEPLRATAGDPNDASYGKKTGVAFFQPVEWDPATEHLGKVARFGEMLPRLGGPNFVINGLDKRSDWVVAVTYQSDTGATVKVYDGENYLKLAELPAGPDWQTVEAKLPAEMLKEGAMDRGAGPGWELLCAFEDGGLWVHRIEVRRAAPATD